MTEMLCHHKSMAFRQPLEKIQEGNSWGLCQMILEGIWGGVWGVSAMIPKPQGFSILPMVVAS